jgi:hypothetical protein
MGFKVPELTANSKAPLAEGDWDMKFVKFTSGESSQKKTPFVQAVFKVVDPEAVDQDGEPYKRNFYGDTFYLTPNAMWRLKKFASEAEVEIPDAGDEYDTLAEYAADLTEAFAGTEVVVSTELEEYESKDGETKVKAVAAAYKF